MKKNWFDSKVKDFSLIGGYQKPQLNDNSLKLDSNENYVLSKQFQNDIVSGARKNSDVREYPLGGVERLIQKISKLAKENNIDLLAPKIGQVVNASKNTELEYWWDTVKKE